MKKTFHIIKYWACNRITWGYAAYAGLLGYLVTAGLNPYINGGIIFFSSLAVVLWMAWTDENPVNGSERLMLRRMANIH